MQGNTEETSEYVIKCVCLNAKCIINKKNEFNIMVDDIKPHIIVITELAKYPSVGRVACFFQHMG